MKNIYLYFLILISVLLSNFTYGQKIINAAPIEGTKLIISAEAETMLKISFSINTLSEGNDKLLNELKSNNLEFPIKFILNPFNQLTFKARIKDELKKLKTVNDSLSNDLNESLFDKGFTNDLDSLYSKKNNDINNLNRLKAEKRVDEKINYLFNYFNAQLLLLFKYDSEPVAGVLHYNNTNVNVQFFENNSYEIFFQNQKKNYHDLIKKLYLKRLELKSEALEGAYDTIIKGHFIENNKEYNKKYVNDPRKFSIDFNDIIRNFRGYNRNKRLELIYEKILQIKNDVIYEVLTKEVEEYNNLDSLYNNQLKTYFSYKKIERDINELDFSKSQLEFQLEKIRYSNISNISLRSKIDSLYKKHKNFLDLFYFNFFANLPNVDLSDVEFNERMSTSEKSRVYRKYIYKKDVYNLEESRNIEKFDYYDRIRNDELYSRFSKDSSQIKIKITKVNDLIRKRELAKSEIKEKYDEIYLNKRYEKYLMDPEKEYWYNHEDHTSVLAKIENSLKLQRLSIFKKLNSAPLWKFKPSKIQIDFNDGFIEHLIVQGKITGISSNFFEEKTLNKRLAKIFKDYGDFLKGITVFDKQLKFVNEFPYGFSSTKDFDDFKEYKLSVYKGRHKQFEVQLEALFPNYVQTLQNDRLDFSPKDGVVTIHIDEKDNSKSIELKKEKSSKLFSLSVYSDFKGLDNKDPNGVLQFEFNKRIPLYTKRRTTLLGSRYLNRGFNYGPLNYINPQFRWSRLVSNNDENSLILSYLPVFTGTNDNFRKYVTQLNLLSFENISLGVDLNLISFDFPTSKLRLEINASGRYGITKVVDTGGQAVSPSEEESNVLNRFDVNTWRFYPEFILRLRPEERYGAALSFRPIRFNTVTNDFSNISSENSFTNDLNDNEMWLHQIEINAYFSPTGKKDDRFFFKYRYTNTSNWEYNGFSELQVGYSMSLKF